MTEDSKRARNWKRRTQPRVDLKNDAPVLYLPRAGREINAGLVEKLLKLERPVAERFYALYCEQFNPDLTVPESVVEEWISVGTFRAKGRKNRRQDEYKTPVTDYYPATVYPFACSRECG